MPYRTFRLELLEDRERPYYQVACSVESIAPPMYRFSTTCKGKNLLAPSFVQKHFANREYTPSRSFMKNKISGSTRALSVTLCRGISLCSPIRPYVIVWAKQNGQQYGSIFVVHEEKGIRTPHEGLHHVAVGLWHHCEHGEAPRSGAEHDRQLAPVERFAAAVVHQAHQDCRENPGFSLAERACAAPNLTHTRSSAPSWRRPRARDR